MSIKIHLINKYDCFITVESSIDKSKLTDCQLFDDEPSMMVAAAERHNDTVDALEGNTIIFRYCTLREEWLFIDHRGAASPVFDEEENTPIEQWISDFEL